MEKEKTEEIIAYRIGEGLFCLSCYEKEARKLRDVQDPDGPEIKIPAKPLTGDDVEIFKCKQCKEIKGPLTGGVKNPKARDLYDLEDMLMNCLSRVALLIDFVTHNVPEDELFSKNGRLGFYHVLAGLRDDLELLSEGLSKKPEMNSNVERQEAT
jgi:hypothetical protein